MSASSSSVLATNVDCGCIIAEFLRHDAASLLALRRAHSGFCDAVTAMWHLPTYGAAPTTTTDTTTADTATADTAGDDAADATSNGTGASRTLVDALFASSAAVAAAPPATTVAGGSRAGRVPNESDDDDDSDDVSVGITEAAVVGQLSAAAVEAAAVYVPGTDPKRRVQAPLIALLLLLRPDVLTVIRTKIVARAAMAAACAAARSAGTPLRSATSPMGRYTRLVAIEDSPFDGVPNRRHSWMGLDFRGTQLRRISNAFKFAQVFGNIVLPDTIAEVAGENFNGARVTGCVDVSRVVGVGWPPRQFATSQLSEVVLPPKFYHSTLAGALIDRVRFAIEGLGGDDGINGAASEPTAAVTSVIPSNFACQAEIRRAMVLPETVTEVATDAFALVAATDLDMTRITTLRFVLPQRSFAGARVSGTLALPATLRELDAACFSLARVHHLDLSRAQIRTLATNCFDRASFNRVSFPSSLTSIGKALAHVTFQTGIDLSNTQVDVLVGGAFEATVVSNGNLVLPACLTRVQSAAFTRITVMRGSIDLSTASTLTCIHEGTFAAAKAVALLLPPSVNEIQHEAFAGLTLHGDLDLTTTSLRSISKGAFDGATIEGRLAFPPTLAAFSPQAFVRLSCDTLDCSRCLAVTGIPSNTSILDADLKSIVLPSK